MSAVHQETTQKQSAVGVRLRQGGRAVTSDDSEMQLRGVLESISNRFWSGWGYATLSTDKGETVKITGALEGHVAGTSVIVRGAFKESNYGRQLECSSIVVDSVSGELTVIRAWARKNCEEYVNELTAALHGIHAAQRWERLSDPSFLVSARFEQEAARSIAAAAKMYLLLIEAKKGLMTKGFTDHEAEKMCDFYGERVEQKLESDPFAVVLDGILGFNRIDGFVAGKLPRNEPKRLWAAMLQALVSAQQNGHTAQPPMAVFKDAATMAGVYPETVAAAGLPPQIVEYKDHYQLRGTQWAETIIARFVTEALRIVP